MCAMSIFFIFFFLFKQKTAYEIRISDWSSDVCSSDLGSNVHAAGIVTQRQRPQTASGTIFVTLEDEHGTVNVIVWPRVAQRRRKVLLNSTLLAVRGRWEQVAGVEHLVARDPEALSAMLGGLQIGRAACREGGGQTG